MQNKYLSLLIILLLISPLLCNATSESMSIEVISNDANVTQGQFQTAKTLSDVNFEDTKANIEKDNKAERTNQEIADIKQAAHGMVS